MTEKAERVLGASLGSESDRDAIAEDIEQGYSELWEIDGGASYLVSRIESQYVVGVCFGGEDLPGASEFILRAAAKLGKPVRLHTKRPGMGRLMKRFNPEVLETIYRIESNGW